MKQVDYENEIEVNVAICDDVFVDDEHLRHTMNWETWAPVFDAEMRLVALVPKGKTGDAVIAALNAYKGEPND